MFKKKPPRYVYGNDDLESYDNDDKFPYDDLEDEEDGDLIG